MLARKLASTVFALSALATLLGGGGCQALVGSEVPAFRCEGELDAGVCPEGHYCIGATCARCEETDVCDGRDNDCDGVVDNGSDKDGDGFTLCGRLDPSGERLVDVDCDDNDPRVFPGAEEICNGKDDDCDGLIDNGACPAGQTCAPKTGECVDDAVACTETGCTAPAVCDPGTRRCIEPGAAKLGDPCKSDGECEPGRFCAYAPVLTTDIVQQDGLCTQPCCTSSDCPADFVCFGGGSGGSYCVGKGVVGRPSVGAGAGGTACTQGAECRSGRCNAAGRCEDTCCRPDHCQNGTVCRATSVTGIAGKSAYVLGCERPEGSASVGDNCTGILSDDCAQGVCHDQWRRCVVPCCGSRGCGAMNVPGQGNRQLFCDNVRPYSRNELVTACGNATASRGAKAVGEACSTDAECEGMRCYAAPDGTSYCSDACCTDADCGTSGLVCRPYDVSGFFVLRCLRP